MTGSARTGMQPECWLGETDAGGANIVSSPVDLGN